MMDVLAGALSLAKDELGGNIQITVNRLEIADDLPAFDLTVRHRTGLVPMMPACSCAIARRRAVA